MTEITSPLDQFEIRNLIGINAPIFANVNLSLTNIGLYLTVGIGLILAINLIANNYQRIVSNK